MIWSSPVPDLISHHSARAAEEILQPATDHRPAPNGIEPDRQDLLADTPDVVRCSAVLVTAFMKWVLYTVGTAVLYSL